MLGDIWCYNISYLSYIRVIKGHANILTKFNYQFIITELVPIVSKDDGNEFLQ
jgi:hypothetical protein